MKELRFLVTRLAKIRPLLRICLQFPRASPSRPASRDFTGPYRGLERVLYGFREGDTNPGRKIWPKSCIPNLLTIFLKCLYYPPTNCYNTCMPPLQPDKPPLPLWLKTLANIPTKS